MFVYFFIVFYVCAVLAKANNYILCTTRQTFNAKRQGYAKLRIVSRNALFITQHLPDFSHFLGFLPLITKKKVPKRSSYVCTCLRVYVCVRTYVCPFQVLNQLIDLHETPC